MGAIQRLKEQKGERLGMGREGAMSKCKGWGVAAGVRGYMQSHSETHTHTPVSHCNKVILRPAQASKVQERECGRNRIKTV